MVTAGTVWFCPNPSPLTDGPHMHTVTVRETLKVKHRAEVGLRMRIK